MARKGLMWRCPRDGKHAFSSYRLAASVGARAEEPGRPYWCPAAGGYHISRYTPAEVEQHRAAHLTEEVA